MYMELEKRDPLEHLQSKKILEIEVQTVDDRFGDDQM